MSAQHPWQSRDGAGNFLRVRPDGSVSVHVSDDWYSGHISRDTAEALFRELATVLGFSVKQELFGRLAPSPIEAPDGSDELDRLFPDLSSPAARAGAAKLLAALRAEPVCTACHYPAPECRCLICEGDPELCDCSYHDNARRAESTH